MWKLALAAIGVGAGVYVSRRWLFQKYLKFRETVDVITNTESCTLKFVHRGQPVQLHVPYNRRRRNRDCQTQVRLILVTGETVDITQMPGIPYLVTPGQLGGIRAEITDDSGDIIPVEMDEMIEF